VTPGHGFFVQAGELAILQQQRLNGGACLAVAGNGGIFIGVEVAFDPVIHIEHMIRMYRAASVCLQDETFHRAKRIVVQLRQPVVGLAVVGKQAAGLELRP